MRWRRTRWPGTGRSGMSPGGQPRRRTRAAGQCDPEAALWGGADGLDAIRVIEEAARRLLRSAGRVAVEHGAPQGAAVYWVFAEERGWRETRNHADLAGRDRFVTATWP